MINIISSKFLKSMFLYLLMRGQLKVRLYIDKYGAENKYKVYFTHLSFKQRKCCTLTSRRVL